MYFTISEPGHEITFCIYFLAVRHVADTLSKTRYFWFVVFEENIIALHCLGTDTIEWGGSCNVFPVYL